MTEKQLYNIVEAIMLAGLTALGAPWTGVKMRQGYQPSITGVPSGPFLSLSNQPWRRYGFVKRANAWDPSGDGAMIHTETQQWTGIYQFDAQWKQDPTAANFIDVPTANDLARVASNIMQSDNTVAALVAAGIGIDRVTDVRQMPFKDDFDAFEYSPAFDFCLTFPEAIVSTGNPATVVQGIYPV